MRVWIVNPFDNLPLEGNRPQRYWLMARAFARAGHDVVLWTSDFSHARKRTRELTCDCGAVRISGSGFRIPEGGGDGFRLELVPTPAYPRNICLRRILSHRAFARRWGRMAGAEGSWPDVVVASLPPLASGREVLSFCEKAGAKFVLDVMDAWPETFYRLAPPFLFAPLRRVARRLYRGADAVSCVASRYVELARSYGATCPLRLAWHGIELPRGRQPARAVSSGGAFRLVYAGAMGASYDLETVVAGVEGMDGVELDLAGTGPKEPALRRLAGKCPRIRFHGYLDADGLAALLRDADVALVPMLDDSCVGVPYKLADYAAAGLAVLNTLHGETERLLAEHGAGMTYPARDAGAFRAALDRLRSADLAALRAGALALAERFDAVRVYGGFVEWVEGLFARPVSSGVVPGEVQHGTG